MPDPMRQYLRRKYPALPDYLLDQKEAQLTASLESYRQRSGKRCPKCERFLPLSSYESNSAASDGLATYCKACR